MLTRFSRFTSFVAFGLLGLLAACKPADEGKEPTGTSSSEAHDHGHEHPRPASLADGVAQIKTHLKSVEDAFANNKPQECDDALHELAEILDVLPQVAADSDLPKESWEEVKKASGGLFDALMKIHEGFHGENAQGATYSDVKSAIDENLAVLESKASEGGKEAGSAEASAEEPATEAAP